MKLETLTLNIFKILVENDWQPQPDGEAELLDLFVRDSLKTATMIKTLADQDTTGNLGELYDELQINSSGDEANKNILIGLEMAVIRYEQGGMASVEQDIKYYKDLINNDRAKYN